MYVKSIKIINFRNYENQNFEFSPNINKNQALNPKLW